MPTPISSVLGSGPRREIVTLTASNASLAIPSWAQGGKGIVYVTGCGGGGGGAAATNASSSAASAIGHPLNIPSGATTMGLTVGAAGAATVAGGHTDIAIGGTNVLRLQGGTVGAPGLPAFWTGAAWQVQSYANNSFNANLLHSISSWTLQRGLANNASTPGVSPFGGAAVSEAATGYGSGGGINQPGSPGFLILEFVEGF